MEELNAYIANNEVRIGVNNIKDFNELIEKAYEEAEQLRLTIHKLSTFDLKFVFDFNSNSSQ